MQSVESGSSAHPSPSSSRQGLNWTMKGGGITFGVMVLVLIVALLFAANQNDVIGWLLVIIAGGWLLLIAPMSANTARTTRELDALRQRAAQVRRLAECGQKHDQADEQPPAGFALLNLVRGELLLRRDDRLGRGDV